MSQDRKSTPLKALQGRIWDKGFQSGALRAELFNDVAPSLRAWRKQGRRVAIFSSGSVRAQQALFAHTTEGDLRNLIDGWFDTETGSKKAPQSYSRIAERFEVDPESVLFVSDLAEELKAARAAGLQTFLARRPGNGAQFETHPFLEILSLEEIVPTPEADALTSRAARAKRGRTGASHA
jgi:enolase-phosphatase E1